jgi:hypothetical protein
MLKTGDVFADHGVEQKDGFVVDVNLVLFRCIWLLVTGRPILEFEEVEGGEPGRGAW